MVFAAEEHEDVVLAASQVADTVLAGTAESVNSLGTMTTSALLHTTTATMPTEAMPLSRIETCRLAHHTVLQ